MNLFYSEWISFNFTTGKVFAEEIHLFPLCDVVFAICFFFILRNIYV